MINYNIAKIYFCYNEIYSTNVNYISIILYTCFSSVIHELDLQINFEVI